jgi:hypothetical protein
MKKSKKKPGPGKKPDRIAPVHGSTTQGGSNFGQGSSQLDSSSIKQGSESADGAGYEQEQGWNNEALRQEDIRDE